VKQMDRFILRSPKKTSNTEYPSVASRYCSDILTHMLCNHHSTPEKIIAEEVAEIIALASQNYAAEDPSVTPKDEVGIFSIC
jgi:hypothetical protein